MNEEQIAGFANRLAAALTKQIGPDLYAGILTAEQAEALVIIIDDMISQRLFANGLE